LEKLEINVLGPVQLTLAGKPLAGLVSAKAKALLVYLAIERRPCSRSALAGLLWSDLPEDDARRNLRVEVSKLRRWLNPYLVFTSQEASINPTSPYLVDVHEFEDWVSKFRAQASSPDLSQMMETVALYRGDFLSHFQVRAAPLFEEWVLVERERLRQLALDLLDQINQAAIQQQDWKAGLFAARKSLAIDSWREKSHRQLMIILVLSGDRSAALAQFETARRILVQELGVEPGPETLALYQRIKQGELIPPASSAPMIQIGASPPPHNLPAPTTSFIGRQAELAQVAELLADPGCRLLTLTGPGGIGKTRLALEICWKLFSDPAAIFKDGLYFVPLASLTDPDLLAPTIAGALDLSLSGSQEAQKQLAQHLKDKRMLLVLDNFEQLVEAAPVLVEILRGAPGVKLLVTSRHQLDLYEEWVFSVEGMSYPAHVDRAGWQDFSAVQLFQQRARRVNLRFSVEEHRDCIVHLCQLLEGLPLGIELAAAWLQVLPCEQISRLIEHNLDLPENRIRNLPPRQRSLRAVLQYSWDLLSEEEQHTLARIAVFQPGFTPQAAEAVARSRPRTLAGLVSKSLLRFTSDGRYGMHSLLQAFAQEKLAEPELDAVREAHSHYYGAYLSVREQDISGPRETAAIDEIAMEIGNIRLGWQWAIGKISATRTNPSSPPSPKVLTLIEQYLPMLSAFYQHRSWFHEGQAVFSHAASTMENAGFDQMEPTSRAPFLLGSVCLARARFCRVLGQNKTAHSLVLKGLSLLGQASDSLQIADAWHLLGQIEHQMGAGEAADQAYHQSLDIYRCLNNPTGIASNLISLGVLAKNRGDLSQASDLYMECLEIFRQRDDPRGIWVCLINLGNIANVQQDYQQAKRLYEESLTTLQGSGDKSRQALTLVNLGSVARETDACEQALQYYLESLKIGEETGEKRILIASLDGLGKTYLNQGDLAAAQDYLLKALRNAIEANLLPQALDSLASLGRLKTNLGEMELALELLAFVTNHPASPEHARRDAQSDFDLLKAELPTDVVAKAVHAAQEISLEGILVCLGITS
jgi:predicted ATPase/DNA-binding SARP family transcriptional activator